MRGCPMQESYHITVDTGDIVLMPNGTVGVVTYWDITMGEICKEVRVYPFTNCLHRLFLTLTHRTWFYDRDINKLKPIHKNQGGVR